MASEVAATIGAEHALLDAAPAMFAIVHQCMELVASVAAEHASRRADEQRHRRERFLHALLLDGAVDDCQEHGIDLGAEYVAFRARAPEAARLSKLQRDLERDNATIVSGFLFGDLIGVLSTPPRLAIDNTRLGVGPTVAPSELHSSFEVATRAVECAVAFDRDGVVDLASFGVRAGVVADHVLSRLLYERYFEQ